MDAKALIAKLLQQREVTVELEPGKTVTLRRPTESDMPRIQSGFTVEHLREFGVRWDGITEADLLGAAVGASDPAPWDPALWAAVVADRGAWFRACTDQLWQVINDHFAAKAGAEKN